MCLKGAHPEWRKDDSQDYEATIEANYAERSSHMHELYLASKNATGLQASPLLCSNHSPSKDTPIHRQLLGVRMHELLIAQTLTKFGESTEINRKTRCSMDQTRKRN